MGHVFVSYSKSDNDYAMRLVQKLRQEGFDVWIDHRSLHNSEDWWRSIVLAIWQADAVIVLLTPRSDESRWVQREITIADNRKKPMFPLLLEGDIETPNWSLFVRTQYTDVIDGSLPPAEFYEELARYTPRNPGGGRNVTDTGQQQIATLSQSDPAFRDAISNAPQEELLQNSATISKTVTARNPSKRSALLKSAILLIGVLVLGLVISVAALTGGGGVSTPTPTASPTPTQRPVITFTPVPTTDQNLDPAAAAVTVGSINSWRAAQGRDPLEHNNKLDSIASVHLNYLATLPLDTIRDDLPYLSAEGLTAQGMAQIAGYSGEVQMFIYVPGPTSPTLQNLIDLFEQLDPNDQMQVTAQDIGLADQFSEDTGLHYLVVLLGIGEGGTS
ncbi:MAG TPA: toll/interleukin-1 receptor domain-containing protein [Aggregatilineales bacterium]|nr:toll/interleukin-1 receptor domain-containing protein [Aggregatilineales bacterium]